MIIDEALNFSLSVFVVLIAIPVICPVTEKSSSNVKKVFRLPCFFLLLLGRFLSCVLFSLFIVDHSECSPLAGR